MFVRVLYSQIPWNMWNRFISQHFLAPEFSRFPHLLYHFLLWQQFSCFYSIFTTHWRLLGTNVHLRCCHKRSHNSGVRTSSTRSTYTCPRSTGSQPWGISSYRTTNGILLYPKLKTIKPGQKSRSLSLEWFHSLGPLRLDNHTRTILLCSVSVHLILSSGEVSVGNLVPYQDQNLVVNYKSVDWGTKLPAHFFLPSSCQFPASHILDLSPKVSVT